MAEQLREVLHDRQARSILGSEDRERQQHTAEQLLALGLSAVGLAPEQLPALPRPIRETAVAWLIRETRLFATPGSTKPSAWATK